VKPSDDDRSPIALAMAWATQIIAASLVMVVPAVLGYWVDRWVGSKVVFTLIGTGLGMTLGGLQLAHLVRQIDRRRKSKDRDRDGH
jgi:F0F1-type ATP synthase assembly protein I